MSTDAKRQANKRWNDKNRDRYDRIHLALPKGYKVLIQQAAEKSGLSVNAYIINAVTNHMKLIK